MLVPFLPLAQSFLLLESKVVSFKWKPKVDFITCSSCMLRNFNFSDAVWRQSNRMINTRAQVPRHDPGKKESPRTNPYCTWNGSVIFAGLNQIPIVYSAARGRAENNQLIKVSASSGLFDKVLVEKWSI